MRHFGPCVKDPDTITAVGFHFAITTELQEIDLRQFNEKLFASVSCYVPFGTLIGCFLAARRRTKRQAMCKETRQKIFALDHEFFIGFVAVGLLPEWRIES